jgi:hypothetical protein
VAGGIGKKLSGLGDRFSMRISPHRVVDGLWIGVLGNRSDLPLIDRVEDALRLIERTHPVRYRQVRRDVRRIWIVHQFGALGSFLPEQSRCDLDHPFVRTASPEEIAATIVHEATHGHPCLRKLGYPEELRHRIERICGQRELEFARLLPGAEELCAEIERSLAREPEFWTTESLRAWELEGAIAAAKDAGAPDWLVRLVLAVRRLRERLHGKARP